MKRKNRIEIIIGALVLVVISFLTIGYASFTQLLTLQGTTVFKPNGVARITAFAVNDSSNMTDEDHDVDGLNVSFEAAFQNVGSNADYYVLYDVTIQNDSFYSYDFTESTVIPDVSLEGGPITISYEVIGINDGETIPSGESKSFQVKVVVSIEEGYSGDINVEGDINNDVEQEFIGSLLASVTGSTSGDLVNNSKVQFTVSVANSYTYNKTINFALGSNNFSIIDCTTEQAFQDVVVHKNSTESFTFCVKANQGAEFYSPNQTPGLFLTSVEHGNSVIDTLNLTVTQNAFDHEIDPPVISNVQVSRTVGVLGSITITWDAYDESDLLKFYIVRYETGEDPVTYETVSNEQTKTFTDISESKTYNFIIYGEDVHHQSGVAGVSDPDESSGIAVETGNMTFSWHYAVDDSGLSYINSDGDDTVLEGDNYTATLTATGGRNLPTNLTITMEGKSGNLTRCNNTNNCNGYYFRNGSLIIYNVTGNLTISGTATGGGTCLVKGTPVLLADNTYKNIEDIGYDDLLAVWDYKNGKVTYEYPIWIEQEKEATIYQKTTFSDGTILNTAGDHAVYDLNKKMFVNINDPEEVRIGSKIAKIKNGKIVPVTVKKIEYINENVIYYHVVSTTYYNIIANDILTTDDATILSNLYGFTKNITWPKSRNKVIADSNNLYEYSEINNTLPYYMFEGLRAREAKYLVNMGYLTDLELQYYFLTNQSNPEMVQTPINILGRRIWPVSIDDNKYFVLEGNTITLPDSNIKCFYNTSNDTCYKPNDKLTIYYGTHFISK